MSWQPVFLTKAQRQQLVLQQQEEEIAEQKRRCGIDIIKRLSFVSLLKCLVILIHSNIDVDKWKVREERKIIRL